MAEQVKIKSVVAIYLVLMGMAGFVYLLIIMPMGGGDSSGSGYRVECHRIGVLVVVENSREPVENAQVEWWLPPSPERHPRLQSPVAPDRQERPAPPPEKPKATGITSSTGKCVLSVTVWEQGGADRDQDTDADAPKLAGVLKVQAKGFEPFSKEMALRLPPDPKAPVEVTLKPIETTADAIPLEPAP